MIQPWPVIADRYRAALRDASAQPFWRAVERVAALAETIANGPLSQNVVGWTSMHDLFIQRVGDHPFVAPYLRVSPLSSGTVEFRMIDARLNEGQWRREVPAAETLARADAFLEEIGWRA